MDTVLLSTHPSFAPCQPHGPPLLLFTPNKPVPTWSLSGPHAFYLKCSHLRSQKGLLISQVMPTSQRVSRVLPVWNSIPCPSFLPSFRYHSQLTWHFMYLAHIFLEGKISLEGNSLICQGWLPPKSRISKEGREIFYCFIQFWFTFYKPKLLYHKLTYYFKRNRWWMFVGGVCGRGREVKVKEGRWTRGDASL